MQKYNDSKPVTLDKLTWAQCTRDLLWRAMETGQLIPLTISVIFIILAIKIPKKNLGELIHKIYDGMISGQLWGWSLAMATLFFWFINTKNTNEFY